MKTLLQINSSLFSGAGQSSRLASQFAAAWPGKVVVRDLAADPVPHLDAERFGAFTATERTPAQQAVVDYSDALIGEVERADVIALGLPMYNFGLPSQLKAWFDHIARVGRTFRYTAKGSEGLLKGKKAYVFAARGGLYEGTAADTQTPYVRDFLRFLGIEDVEFVYAEGLAISDDSRKASLERASAAVERLGNRAELAEAA